MSDDWFAQVSYKFGARDHMVNVRSDNPADLGNAAKLLDWTALEQAAPENQQRTITAEQAVANVQNAFPGSQEVAPNFATFAGQVTQHVNNGAPLPQAPAAPPAPTCMHGPRVHRSGNKNGKAWSAWFCPQPKGASDQCGPEWG